MIKAFPKIFAIGTDYIRDIFQEEVEVTEKVDGSQFAFGKINGELCLRSKGATLYVNNPEKMFAEGIDYIASIEHLLPEGLVFYTEYLKRPKHNTLSYGRVPHNHLMLFGVMHLSQRFIPDLEKYAQILDIEPVPVIYRDRIDKAEELTEMINRESILGGANIEGVVVKNYARPFLLGGQPIPIMAGKFVSEKFKEVHNKTWSKEKTSRGKFDIFKDNYRTEARWEKAIQHLRDNGLLLNEPRDIGNLIKEVHRDIAEEEKENIRDFLWKEFGKEVLRYSTAGLPEWYKGKLAERSF